MHLAACAYAASRREDALNDALEASLPLCALIARRFMGRGVDYEDLYQVASMACVQALKGFDPGRGLQFSSYVTPTITGTVRNYLRDKGSLLRTPRGMQEQMTRLGRVRGELTEKLRREPTPRELSESLGWPLSQVLDILSAKALSAPASLDAETDEGGSLKDTLSFLDGGFERMETRQDLQKAMAELSEQEKRLLALRFSGGLSQREAAQRLNMSQMQVSRAERRALTTLRRELTAFQ